MIPARDKTFYTDGRRIVCDACKRPTFVSPAKTDEEVRAIAARSGWTTFPGKGRVKVHDLCPKCSEDD